MAFYNIITAVLGLILATGILYLIRKDYLHPIYSMWWILVAVGSLVFGIYPKMSDIIAERLGVGYPPVLIITIATVILFAKSLIMDIERTKNKCMLRKLTQEVSILKKELECLKNQIQKLQEKQIQK